MKRKWGITEKVFLILVIAVFAVFGGRKFFSIYNTVKSDETYASEKEIFKEAECIMVTVNIKNMSEEKQRVTLDRFALTSQAWTNCAMPDKYMAVNKKWNSEQYQSGPIYIESGEEQTLILPFLLVKKGFRQKQWEHVKERNYELVLSLYPVKKQIKLKCV